MKELTREQAIALAETNFWEKMTAREIAVFQHYTRLLCMPFSVFHKAMEETLGRPVFTHELGLPEARERMERELEGEIGPPTFEEIIGLIPEEKRLIVKL